MQEGEFGREDRDLNNVAFVYVDRWCDQCERRKHVAYNKS